MKVFTFVQAKVQVAECRARKGFEKNRGELDVPRADLRFRQRDLPHEERPPRKIDGRRDERFVHRQCGPAVTDEADLVADGLEHRLPEDDAEVFSRMVPVDFDIALRQNGEIEKPVTRDLLDHVRKKRQRRLYACPPGPVEVELDGDVGFARLSSDFCRTCHGRAIPRKGFSRSRMV